MKDAGKLNKSFSFQDDTKKKRILTKLGQGDFIKTNTFIYKIKSIDTNIITVYKGGAH